MKSTVMQAFNPSTWEAEAGAWSTEFQASTQDYTMKPFYQNSKPKTKQKKKENKSEDFKCERTAAPRGPRSKQSQGHSCRHK